MSSPGLATDVADAAKAESATADEEENPSAVRSCVAEAAPPCPLSLNHLVAMAYTHTFTLRTHMLMQNPRPFAQVQ